MGSAIRRIVVHTTVAPTRISAVVVVVVGGCWRLLLAVVVVGWRLLAVVVVVAEKSCCDADNERSDERTKATSSHVDLVGLKVFSSVELSRT
jgi:hypothetical protein